MKPDQELLHTCLKVTEETLAELKGCLLETYDDNKDGKIDIREVGCVDNKIQESI